MPPSVGEVVDYSRISFEAAPAESGQLINQVNKWEVDIVKDANSPNKWNTSTVYWYGVLPNRECRKIPNKYSFKMKVDGKDCLTRECPVYWPETKGKAYWNLPQNYKKKIIVYSEGGWWYSVIQSVKFIKSSGEIGTEPPGSELNPDWHWTGQYEEDVMKEEKYHLKTVLATMEKETNFT